MVKYIDILLGYVNNYKQRDGKYLSIKNVSKEPMVIEPGETIFLNMTPKDVRDKHPKIPMFKMQNKVEELDPDQAGNMMGSEVAEAVDGDDVATARSLFDDIPF